MKASLIAIGNSKGVRIPKSFIEACGFSDTLDMKLKDNQLILSPHQEPRAAWQQAFLTMREQGDDILLDGDIVDHEWDNQSWEW